VASYVEPTCLFNVTLVNNSKAAWEGEALYSRSWNFIESDDLVYPYPWEPSVSVNGTEYLDILPAERDIVWVDVDYFQLHYIPTG
jgi:hypothetical protein